MHFVTNPIPNWFQARLVTSRARRAYIKPIKKTSKYRKCNKIDRQWIRRFCSIINNEDSCSCGKLSLLSVRFSSGVPSASVAHLKYKSISVCEWDLPDIRRCQNHDAVDILFVISNPPSADDVWHGSADLMYTCICRLSANGYHDV